jgi:hypothetical protein
MLFEKTKKNQTTTPPPPHTHTEQRAGVCIQITKSYKFLPSIIYKQFVKLVSLIIL